MKRTRPSSSSAARQSRSAAAATPSDANSKRAKSETAPIEQQLHQLPLHVRQYVVEAVTALQATVVARVGAPAAAASSSAALGLSREVVQATAIVARVTQAASAAVPAKQERLQWQTQKWTAEAKERAVGFVEVLSHMPTDQEDTEQKKQPKQVKFQAPRGTLGRRRGACSHNALVYGVNMTPMNVFTLLAAFFACYQFITQHGRLRSAPPNSSLLTVRGRVPCGCP